MALKSNKFKLKVIDYLKGLILAVGTPVLYGIQELIPSWPLSPIERIGLSAFVTYVIKNFFSDTVGQAQKTLIKEVEKSTMPYADKKDAIESLQALKKSES